MAPIPLLDDLVKPILDHLTDSIDLRNCALVNLVFHQAAVAILYTNLHIRHVAIVSSRLCLM